jgi:hypothetical protein
MSDFTKFDEHDPFTQLMFKSVVASLVCLFIVASLIWWLRPTLASPLFAPIAMALFIGTLGFQVEIRRKHYLLAPLWFAMSAVLFPLSGLLLLILFRVPYETTPAKFIPLLPQALIAPALFEIARRRFSFTSNAK